MCPYDSHLKVRQKPVYRPESCRGPYGKYILEKALLPIAGPHVKVIHIKTFNFYPAIYIKSEDKKTGYKNDIQKELSFVAVADILIKTVYSFFKGNESL